MTLGEEALGATARVFNIQRFSIQDGPGIRTTVFFQGCPLGCTWCHNPEGRTSEAVLPFHKNLCRSCFTCRAACPENAILEGPDARVDRNKCTLCMKCAMACPYAALTVSGKVMNVDEIFNQVSRDTVFYRNSGGGVTASGGEPLVQAEAVIELFRRCRDRGIRTALDTCGSVSWEVLEEVSSLADLVLYDLKGLDSGKHKEWTGIGNEVILDNLLRLSWGRTGDVRIRVPLIPGFNDCPEDLERMAEFLRRIPVQGLDVLPYHSFGEAKYRALGLTYRLTGVPDYDHRLAEERISTLRAAVADVTIGG